MDVHQIVYHNYVTNMKYLCLVLYLLISFKECTIDINIRQLQYLADHMSAEECRRLFASLYFDSDDIPIELDDAQEEISRNIPCIKLLVKWNSGVESWEGQGETHAFLKHRLTQLGYYDLADWLGKSVFQQLGKQVNMSLQVEPHLKAKPLTTPKAFKTSETKVDDKHWTKFDSIISVALFGMVFITLAAFCRMLKLSFRRVNVRRSCPKHGEELVDLLSAGSVESDQETVYELDVENRKRSRIIYEDQPRKAGSDGPVK